MPQEEARQRPTRWWKKRWHLFEFSDLPRWPALFRTLATDYLMAVAERFKPFSPRLDALAKAMDAVGTDQVVDLCSGSGGSWAYLAEEFVGLRGRPVKLLLTDKFPDPDAEGRLAGVPGFEYLQESIDARCVPSRLSGIRTLLNGFHHFRPNEAREILQDAVRSGQPIAVFEMLTRSWRYFVFLFLTPFLVLLITPKIRPFRLSWVVFCFLIPVIPLCLLWDSLVSVLRCYTVDELTAMTKDLTGEAYEWEIGTYWRGLLPVTYLVGYPKGRSV